MNQIYRSDGSADTYAEFIAYGRTARPAGRSIPMRALAGLAKMAVALTAMAICIHLASSVSLFLHELVPAIPSIIISGFTLEVGTSATTDPSDTVYFATLAVTVAVFLAARTYIRESVLYPFVAFHAALLVCALLVDLLRQPEVHDITPLLSSFATFLFYIMATSLALFSLLSSTIRSVVAWASVCAMASLSTLVLGVCVINLAAVAYNGSALMFLMYLTMSYGVFGVHVMSISMLVGHTAR